MEMDYLNKNGFFDDHEIIKIGNIEAWIGNGAVLNNYVLEMELPMVWEGAPANIFKARKGWVAFILDENESEWSLAHCYIPDPEHRLTLRQLLIILGEIRESILKELNELLD